MLALVRAQDPALHPELTGLIDAATMEVTPFYAAHLSVEALLELSEGRHDKAREMIKPLLEPAELSSVASPAASAVVELAALFIDAALVRKHAARMEAEYNHFAQSMPILARIRAEILSRIARDKASWGERADALGGESIVAFTEIVPVEEPWERAFDSLTAFIKPREEKRPAEKAGKAKRLAWLVDYMEREVRSSSSRQREAAGPPGVRSP